MYRWSEFDSMDGVEEMPWVSASDIERWVYCPMSWKLAKEGVRADGEAVRLGSDRNHELRKMVTSIRSAVQRQRRETTIWVWWYGIVLFITMDAGIFIALNRTEEIELIARFLATLGLSALGASVLAVVVPWRDWLGVEIEAVAARRAFRELMSGDIPSFFEESDFKGGWFEGGRIEAAMLISTTLISLHAIGLHSAEDASQAGFILTTIALIWALLASWRLQRVLVENQVVEEITRDVDEDLLTSIDETIYTEDEASGMIEDAEHRVRGRPDRIVVMDGSFIPVEHKQGREPARPHASHIAQVRAHLLLMEASVGRPSPFGILQYHEHAHQVHWDGEAKEAISAILDDIRNAESTGQASRNHDQPGKCRSCSRRRACPEALGGALNTPQQDPQADNIGIRIPA